MTLASANYKTPDKRLTWQDLYCYTDDAVDEIPSIPYFGLNQEY